MAYTVEEIDISRYSRLKVDFFYLSEDFNNGADFFFEWSSSDGAPTQSRRLKGKKTPSREPQKEEPDDGGSDTWVTKGSWALGDNFEANEVWFEVNAMEMDVTGINTLRVRFRADCKNWRQKIFIDDVKLWGKA